MKLNDLKEFIDALEGETVSNPEVRLMFGDIELDLSHGFVDAHATITPGFPGPNKDDGGRVEADIDWNEEVLVFLDPAQ